MYSFSAIGAQIDRLLHARPEGLDAATVVSELTRQGLRGDEVSVALTEGVSYRKYDVDARFRVTAATVRNEGSTVSP